MKLYWNMKKGLINRAMLSKRLTGSPNNIRHDFVPDRFKNLISEMEDTIESIVQKHELNPEQKRQASLLIGKSILDACCGSKMFWFDKSNPAVLFADIRKENHILCDGRELKIEPDLQMDFRNMPFADNTFKMVVFDPPHIDNLGNESWMAKKYGQLFPSWETDIKQGFDECMRVLEPNGILIFKWNEIRIKLNQLLKVIEVQPLFGHTSGKHGRTIWMSFMKGVITH